MRAPGENREGRSGLNYRGLVSCDHEIQLKPLARLNWRSLALPDPGLVVAHASYWRQLKRV